MKSTVVDYQFRITCIRIVPFLGAPIYITDHIRDLTLGGNLYRSDAGYEFSGNATESSMTPGTFDLEGIIDLSGLSRAAVASGALDNAKLFVFATVFPSEGTTPVEDDEPIAKGILGRTTLKDDRYSVEVMSLIDALNQPIGKTYGATCPKKFGGQEYAGCKKVVSPSAGTITSVTDRYIFTASALVGVADYFGAGSIVWTTGANVGLKSQEVKSYGVGGVIELHEAFFYPVAIGDQFNITPGCRKRADEDCRDKWSNILNFGGFTRVPSGNTYTARGNN
jgi:uncharacterized phage protein (TIGR02218 family)